MSGETTLTLVGNVVGEVELRFTPSGAAVANFRIASTPRKFNKDTSAWEDQEALFLTVNCWRQLAENCAESIVKGTRVIVVGELKQRAWETKEGEKRISYEIEAEEVGPSVKFASASVNRTERDKPAGNAGADPWASEPPF